MTASMSEQKYMTPFLLICLIGFAAFFSSYLRIPVLPLYAASMGAGPAQVGVINGAFMLTAGLCSIPFGLLADRVGRRLPIIAGIFAAALSSLLVAQCRLPEQMAGAYILFGAGMAAFAPGMLSLVADIMPPRLLGQAYGWYTTAVYCAMAVGPASGGFLAQHLGLQQVFFVSAGLLVVVSLVAAFLLPHGAAHHRSDLRGVVAAGVGLLGNSGFVACLAATLGSCIGFGVFMTFLPLFASSQGLDPGRTGVVFAVQALTNVVSRIPIGRWADSTDRRRVVAAGLLVLGLALLILGQAAGMPQMLACAVLLGIGMALTYTALGALIVELVPTLQRGLAMGMYNSCIYLGMMAGSAGLGLALKRIGYPAGFALAGGVALVGLAIFGMMIRSIGRTYQPEEEGMP